MNYITNFKKILWERIFNKIINIVFQNNFFMAWQFFFKIGHIVYCNIRNCFIK